MDLQVKHISWMFLLTSSSAEQLALLQGGLELLFGAWSYLLHLKACTEQTGKAGTLSHVPGSAESPALGLCPDLTTRVLPR